MNAFQKIYARGGWCGQGSGPGSEPKINRDYLGWLSSVLVRYEIRYILDIGCGDWRLYRDFQWPTGCMYGGVDVVPEVIQRLKPLETSRIGFRCTDAITLPAECFEVDCVLIKDVFAHLPKQSIYSLLQLSGHARLVAIAGDLGHSDTDIAHGHYRPFDVSTMIYEAPLESGALELGRYRKHWRLYRGGALSEL